MTSTIHERWKNYRAIALPGLCEGSLLECQYRAAFFSGCLAALELTVLGWPNPESPSPADMGSIWRLRQDLRKHFMEPATTTHPAIRESSNGDH